MCRGRTRQHSYTCAVAGQHRNRQPAMSCHAIHGASKAETFIRQAAARTGVAQAGACKGLHCFCLGCAEQTCRHGGRTALVQYLAGENMGVLAIVQLSHAPRAARRWTTDTIPGIQPVRRCLGRRCMIASSCALKPISSRRSASSSTSTSTAMGWLAWSAGHNTP